MPIFEYKCKDCGHKYDIFHKSSSNPEEVVCPECESKNSKKLLSSFSSSMNGSSSSGNSFPSGGGCANGMCGLN